MKTKKYLIAGLAFILGGVFQLSAQTTLSGDHIITGDLNVGDGSTKGNLTVAGETGSTAAPGVKVTGDGGVVFEGSHLTGQMPASSANVRFMWYPKKAAFRGGTAFTSVGDDTWVDSKIGDSSFAFGSQTYARGGSSVAFGYNSKAEGLYSVAMGGSGTWANGSDSFAAIRGQAFAQYSLAVGYGSFAYGISSTALSQGYVLGVGALAVNLGSASIGDYSIAMTGGFSVGRRSVAIGEYAQAVAGYSVAIGRFNTVEGTTSAWVETDPLFLVGNGTGNPADDPEVQNRNAFAIYKNGQIKMQRQGDILMGEFGNPEP